MKITSLDRYILHNNEKYHTAECGAKCVLAVGSSSIIANFCRTESCHTKNWVEFHHKSIGAIRCSLATLYENLQRRGALRNVA